MESGVGSNRLGVVIARPGEPKFLLRVQIPPTGLAAIPNIGFDMTKKCRYLISAAVLAACVALAIGLIALVAMLQSARPGVTRVNFDRIEERVTQEEVEAILGEPHLERVDNGLLWCGDGIEIYIAFDGRKNIKHKKLFPSTDTIVDKLRRWLGLAPAE